MSAFEQRNALVFGGTGAVGREVVRRLRAADANVAFTYKTSSKLAESLASETGSLAVRVDLRDRDALKEVLHDEISRQPPSVFIHCAAAAVDKTHNELTTDELDEMFAVNVRAPMLAVAELAPVMNAECVMDVVLTGALDRQQSLPIPAGFAATQGALAGYAMAVAKECPAILRINLIAVGLLDSGLSSKLDGAMARDYETFSALRRPGTADEIARTIVWLALNNTYLNGEVISVNGGI